MSDWPWNYPQAPTYVSNTTGTFPADRLRRAEARIEALEAALHGLYEFCAMDNDIRLDSPVMRHARAALDKDTEK